jgi:hypothetical protein
MDFVKSLDKSVDQTAKALYKPTVIKGLVHLLLAVYVWKLAPEVPQTIQTLFENSYFRLFVFSLVLWTAQFSPSTSILIALAFMITMNYLNKKPLFEFMENTPVAPTQEVAIDSTQAVVNQQMENPQTVSGIENQEHSIVIQPSIVETPNGPSVINPSVVVAPMVVSNGEEKVLVTPNITVIQAPSAAPSAPEQAPAPAPAPEQALAPAPAPAQEAVLQEGCYPLRKFDMSKVYGFEQGEFGSFQA